MKIILSTRNPSKAEQIKAFFTDTSISLYTLDDVGIQGEAIENGVTLLENARKKAIFAKKEGYWTMADDTGLFITALGGEPGIKAARWAGENASTEDTTQYCLDRLKGCSDRTARMETVVVLISPNGEEFSFTGQVSGVLLDTPRTKAQPKMPYSPLFMPDGTNKVWAEMTIEEENAISHRGKAFRQLVDFLSTSIKNN